MSGKAGMHHYLAFDLGAESGRAVLGTLEGDRLSIREIHRFPNRPVALRGHIHWDAYGLFNEMKAALKAVAALGIRPASIGVDTWGVDFGLLAKDGSLLGLPYCYRDPRTLGAMDEFLKLVPREILYEETGIQFLPFNTLFQVYSMVRDRSPLLDAASDLLFMPDLFNYFLTGVKSTEYTIATTSQMYNTRTGGWSLGLFQAMGLSKNLLREAVPPGTILGPLAADVAGETDLKDVSVATTASHDTAAAVAAVPAEPGDWAYISSGTWSCVGTEEPAPIVTGEARDCNFTNEGGICGTVRFLKNVTGLWLLQQCRQAWGGKRDRGYEELVRTAAEAPPFGALIDPDSPDFLNPADMPEAIRTYCLKTGQPPPETSAAVVRTIFESLALKYRLVIDEIRRVTRRNIDRIHVIGGGSRNKVLCQLTADAAGLPVIAGPAEATAVGNILVQAMALGHVASHEAMRDIIRRSNKPDEYEPRGDTAWGEAAERFRTILRA